MPPHSHRPEDCRAPGPAASLSAAQPADPTPDSASPPRALVRCPNLGVHLSLHAHRVPPELALCTSRYLFAVHCVSVPCPAPCGPEQSARVYAERNVGSGARSGRRPRTPGDFLPRSGPQFPHL